MKASGEKEAQWVWVWGEYKRHGMWLYELKVFCEAGSTTLWLSRFLAGSPSNPQNTPRP